MRTRTRTGGGEGYFFVAGGLLSLVRTRVESHPCQLCLVEINLQLTGSDHHRRLGWKSGRDVCEGQCHGGNCLFAEWVGAMCHLLVFLEHPRRLPFV